MSDVTHLIADLIPAATAIAISPLPIVAVVVLLLSKNGLRNAAAFATGWLLAMLAVGATAAFLGVGMDFSTSSQPSQLLLIIKTSLGGILLIAAYRQWSRRPAPGEEASRAKWMETLDSSKAFNSFMLGFALMLVNPKNMPIYISCVGDIVQANLGDSTALAVVLVFSLLASSSLGVPIASYVIGGERAKAKLDSAKVWMLQNNSAILAVLFLIFGLKIVASSLATLLG